jgi:hypothetical protein
MNQTTLAVFLGLFVFLAACAAPSAESPASEITPIAADTGMPVPPTTISPAPAVTEMVVTKLSTYQDVNGALAFDYPFAWMLDRVAIGERVPAAIQLTSWNHEPGLVSGVPADGTIMNLTVRLWDPMSDLAAFVLNQKQAWQASGIALVSEEEATLFNGRAAKEFIVSSSDGEAYFLITALGEDYLIASGSGGLEVVRQVARSIR